MRDIITFSGEEDPNYKTGNLPPVAPLATALVPKQRTVNPKYEPDQALIRGTLFPGLDLPFKNIANTTMPDTPMGEIMAFDFILHELVLYLDTHANDKEAFQLYRNFLNLANEGRRRFVERYGPISHTDMLDSNTYSWSKGPWPWELDERTGDL